MNNLFPCRRPSRKLTIAPCVLFVVTCIGCETATPPLGMVGWWPLDTNVDDVQGTAHGSAFNGGFTSAGKVKGAFYSSHFDNRDGKSGGYVKIASSVPGFENLRPTSGITVDAWVRLGDAVQTSESPIVDHRITDKPAYRLLTAMTRRGDDFNHEVKFVVAVGDGRHLEARSGEGTITPKTWYHIAGTYDGEHARVFINGEERGESSESTFPGTQIRYRNKGIAGNKPPISFGGSFEYSSADDEYLPPKATLKGRIDEVEIFNRALTTDELHSIYGAGALGKFREHDPPNPPAGKPPMDVPVATRQKLRVHFMRAQRLRGTGPVAFVFKVNDELIRVPETGTTADAPIELDKDVTIDIPTDGLHIVFALSKSLKLTTEHAHFESESGFGVGLRSVEIESYVLTGGVDRNLSLSDKWRVIYRIERIVPPR